MGELLGVKKVKIDLSSAYRLLHPRHTVLVSCTDKAGKSNIITLAWTMPTSITPPMVAISISPERYSHELIQETGEFVINVPTVEILKETLFCGRRSGRRVDKFRDANLTPAPAKRVKPPVIEECVAHLECRVSRKMRTGDHTIFIGEVLEAYANEGFDPRRVRSIYHAGGDDFLTSAPEVFTPRL